jgi:drug/metabolite transporter (DMT)-like permease
VSSALLADLDGHLVGGAALVALGAGLALTVTAAARGRFSKNALRDKAASLVVLGVLEALNLALYLAGLRLGPVPVVVALHLTSPILLLLWACARRQRRFGASEALTVALIAGGITLVATTRHAQGGGSVLVASALALGSATAVAALITIVTRTASSIDPDLGAAAQLTLAALLISPSAAVSPPGTGTLVRLAVIGALLLAPGFALYWRALRDLTPATAGIVGLNEAIVAALVSDLVLGHRPTLASLVGTTLILTAIATELMSNRSDDAVNESSPSEGHETV